MKNPPHDRRRPRRAGVGSGRISVDVPSPAVYDSAVG